MTDAINSFVKNSLTITHNFLVSPDLLGGNCIKITQNALADLKKAYETKGPAAIGTKAVVLLGTAFCNSIYLLLLLLPRTISVIALLVHNISEQNKALEVVEKLLQNPGDEAQIIAAINTGKDALNLTPFQIDGKDCVVTFSNHNKDKKIQKIKTIIEKATLNYRRVHCLADSENGGKIGICIQKIEDPSSLIDEPFVQV